MNTSAVPVTRPSARVAEEASRLGTDKAFTDRAGIGGGLSAFQLPTARLASGESKASLESKATVFSHRPAAEQLLPPNPSRTNLSTTPSADMTRASSHAVFPAGNLVPQYRASHAQQQSLLERLLRQDGGLTSADTAALARHKPLSSDIFHEAVLAYLESTDRHDVVMAMLQDERNAQATAPPPPSGGLSTERPVPAETVRPGPTSAATATSRTAANPPREAPELSVNDSHGGGGAKAKLHAPLQRRSHDLLKKGLLETYAQWTREPRAHTRNAHNNAQSTATADLRAPATPSPPPTASLTRQMGTTLAFSPPIAPSLSQVLATLYGMPSALRGDITLLYCDIEDKLRLQYEAYSLIPPAPRVLVQIGAQLRQPMWSAQDTAEAIHLPPVRNHVTGKVVMGTINQLVEELTHVYVRGDDTKTGPSSPSETQANVDAAFAESFFRQHRLVTPSSVLLAKLFERFTVPISLELGFEHFESHGITIHVEDGARCLPRERSQSETVVRLRSTAETAAWDAEQLWPSSRSAAEDERQRPADHREEFTLSPGPPSSSWRAAGGSVGGGGGGGGGGLYDAFDRPPPTEQSAFYGSPMRLVTHYTRSATLWLWICEKIRTKVLSVLLMWMQRHPNHFDVSMIHCVLHFVEECCYEPTQWSDCASTFPQIAELLRDEAYCILDTLERETGRDPFHASAAVPHASAHRAPSERVEVVEALRGGGRGTHLARALPYILSTFAMDDRLKHLRAAVPPSARDVHPTLPTWLSAAVTLPNRQLPAFAYRNDDILGFDTAFRSQAVSADPPVPPAPPPSSFSGGAAAAAAATGGTASPVPGATAAEAAALTQARLHSAAQRALERFGRFAMEDYVAGLTSAHQLLFGLFPAQDLTTLAEHTTAEYLSSRTVRQSHLVVFLRTAADLTAWAVSLLLHAAFLDGEQVSASMTNASIVSSLLNVGGGDFELPTPSLPHAGGSGSGAAPYASSAAGEGSNSGGDARFSPTLQPASGPGRGSPRSVPSVRGHAGTAASKLDVSTLAFVSMAETLLDLVVAFLRVNNVHASYAVFRGFCHPFVQRILHHPTLQTVLNAHTLRRIAKLELFYGIDPHNEDGRTAAGGDDASGSFSPHHISQSFGASITSDVGIGGAHVLPEFLKAVSDSAEFPTIPAIPFHLREMRYAMTQEPTFLTTNCGDFPITKLTTSGEQCEPLVCVVNWRKLRIIDDITQRVNALQMEALFYVSSKSTVVHSLKEDIELERAFKEQLDDVIVTDVSTLQTMANSLLTVLQ